MATGQREPDAFDRMADHFIGAYLDIVKLFDELPCVEMKEWDKYVSEAMPKWKNERPTQWSYRKGRALLRHYPGIHVRRRRDGVVEAWGDQPEMSFWRQVLAEREA